MIIIGLMSGTSLDGLDICAVDFSADTYEILKAETIRYSPQLHQKLSNCHMFSGLDLAQLSVDYGVFCGTAVKKFIKKHSLVVNYISSHGQTVFHTPFTGLTLQIGSGAHIAAESGVSTVCDFRTLDVAMGGQGAPLVPIGDDLLFSDYTYCLNIGGFANVSTSQYGKRVAWDICPANIVLNSFSQKFNKPFDENGDLGRQGQIHRVLLNKLQQIDFYKKTYPKSLGREWVDEKIFPLINSFSISDVDVMRTFYEHIALQIGTTLHNIRTKTFCTGGGTHNSFLIELIKKYSNSEIVIPDSTIINYKEALIFAFLGYKRILQEPNCLASVTGARKDVVGGVIYYV